MAPTFRTGFIAGLFAVLLAALLLIWHWQPERQLRLHSEHLIRSVQAGDWNAVASFVSDDYHDQWNDDRALLRQGLRAVTQLRHVAISAALDSIEVGEREGAWSAKITLSGGDEFATAISARVNSLGAPFKLTWRKQSGRPWDWKLVSVSNPELELPAEL